MFPTRTRCTRERWRPEPFRWRNPQISLTGIVSAAWKTPGATSGISRRICADILPFMRTWIAISMRAGVSAAAFLGLTGLAAGQYLRGVNVSQAEWGDPIQGIYGSEYSYPTAPTFNYFAA